MGKPKKGSKSAEADEGSDVESQQTTQVSEDDDEIKVTKKVEKGSKKSKSKKKSESDQGGVLQDEETSTKKAPVKAKKESKKKKKRGSESENDDGVPSQTVSAFDLLNIDDSDDGGNAEIELNDDKKSKQKKKKESKSVEEPAAGKKGKKKKKDDDEDWDAILAEYQDEGGSASKPAEVEKKEEAPKKDSKKKGKTEPIVNEEPPAPPQDTTTASKKKDKKKKKGGDDDSSIVTTSEPKEPQPDESKEKLSEEAVIDDVSAAGKKKKGPGKAMVAAMQEALKKKREEEERLQREEEERIQLIEEAERLKMERDRLEKEKKELKKQKEKERKERAKAEGRLLTAKQKADKARAESLLKSLRDQGVDVPEIGEKRDTRPSARSMRSSKPKKEENRPTAEVEIKLVEQQVEEKPEPMKTDEQKPESPVIIEVPKEEIRESWDASGEEDNDQDSSVNKEKAHKRKPSESKNEESSSEESESEESENSDESDSSDETESVKVEKKKEVEKDPPEVRIRKRNEEAEKKRTTDFLRAAVVCVLGHVDTGKTKILDKLRRTNVQDGEAGGITQQIGATNVPIDAIKENTRYVKEAPNVQFRIPGLLIIDTPGHESFSNLRTRGSSLCDIAILVVDIMHGLEPQTIESINLLKARKTPFVVALNKIDRLYDWQTTQRKDIRDIVKGQAQNCQNEFDKRTKEVILQFNEQGLNAALFYENSDPRTYVSLVPTSAITGEGMGNLLMLICQFCQNQLAKRLTYSEQLQATVLEVKAIQGLGTTIDAILVNGKLREGETMIVAGTDGPIVTQIRALLLPHPMKELRVKNNYIEQKEVLGAQGIKIAAKDLEKAMAGINLQIAREPDEVEFYKEVISRELKSVLRSIKLSDQGVFVQASTLGSLEALLEFLKTSKIPYAGIRIGPVVKRDVMKASIMLEHQADIETTHKLFRFIVPRFLQVYARASTKGEKVFTAHRMKIVYSNIETNNLPRVQVENLTASDTPDDLIVKLLKIVK